MSATLRQSADCLSRLFVFGICDVIFVTAADRVIPGGAKKRPEHSQVLYSSVIDRFLKFLHCYIQR